MGILEKAYHAINTVKNMLQDEIYTRSNQQVKKDNERDEQQLMVDFDMDYRMTCLELGIEKE